MNLDLTGKRAMVCGSTQGIGKAVAMELASLGATITLVARNETALHEVQRELDSSAGQEHTTIAVDFSGAENVREKVRQFVENSPPVHILVNNSGGPKGGPILDAGIEDIMQAFSALLLCSHIIARELIPGMKKEGWGRIVNIISTSVKQPIPGLGVSNTVRGAVASWAKTLAGEVGPFGITVNNILPGMTRTRRLDYVIRSRAERSGRTPDEVVKDMIAEIPAGRFADPRELAAVVAFLCSPAASYVNGVSIPVDGGSTRSL